MSIDSVDLVSLRKLHLRLLASRGSSLFASATDALPLGRLNIKQFLLTIMTPFAQNNKGFMIVILNLTQYP